MSKKPRQLKKLKVNKESLAKLSDEELQKVGGGYGTFGCTDRTVGCPGVVGGTGTCTV